MSKVLISLDIMMFTRITKIELYALISSDLMICLHASFIFPSFQIVIGFSFQSSYYYEIEKKRFTRRDAALTKNSEMLSFLLALGWLIFSLTFYC